MALNRLLDQMATQGTPPHRGTVSRWTDHAVDLEEIDLSYGAFVDDQGRVVTGSRPYRAFLESDDPTRLELAPQTSRRIPSSATVVFVDWGNQSLSWGEIFELWEAWEGQDMILDCGSVGVPWSLANRWVCPGWVAFRGAFDGAPLITTVRNSPEESSFFAKALRWQKSVGRAEGPNP